MDLLLWRIIVLGVPALPTIWLATRASREIENWLAWLAIGIATYGIAAFLWLGAIAWMFPDWWMQLG